MLAASETLSVTFTGFSVLLLVLALIGACMGRWGAAPLIMTIVAVLLLIIR